MTRFALLLLFVAACKTTAPAAAANPPAAQPRSESDRALDPGRHPTEMLVFLDLRPGMKVADLGAAAGYTTELMARAGGPSGVVCMQNHPRRPPFPPDPLPTTSPPD